jgi:hypothetical protein
MTKALDAFGANIEDVTALLELHRERGGDQVGRRHGLEVLNKSAVVLICSFWEAYCEDLAAEALGHLVKHTTDPKILPVRLRRKVAEELKRDKHDLAVWSLANDGWRSILQARLADFQRERNRQLMAPKSAQVDDLFDHTIGLERVSESWSWSGSTVTRSRRNLDKGVSLRGDIAHRGQAATSVHKRQVLEFHNLTQRIVNATELGVIEWVAETTGKPLLPEPAADPALKRCCRCGEERERHLFSRRSGVRDGLQSACKACSAVYRAKRRVAA